VLQYQFELETSAYIDIAPLRSRATSAENLQSDESDSESDSGSAVQESGEVHPEETAEASFHQTVDGHAEQRQNRVDAHSTPLEKQLALRERERRWETIDPAVTRKFRVGGPAGVYELQEGIFLMCDDYSDNVEGRVSWDLWQELISAHVD